MGRIQRSPLDDPHSLTGRRRLGNRSLYARRDPHSVRQAVQLSAGRRVTPGNRELRSPKNNDEFGCWRCPKRKSLSSIILTLPSRRRVPAWHRRLATAARGGPAARLIFTRPRRARGCPLGGAPRLRYGARFLLSLSL